MKSSCYFVRSDQDFYVSASYVTREVWLMMFDGEPLISAVLKPTITIQEKPHRVIRVQLLLSVNCVHLISLFTK
jgi:hypothetical protein